MIDEPDALCRSRFDARALASSNAAAAVAGLLSGVVLEVEFEWASEICELVVKAPKARVNLFRFVAMASAMFAVCRSFLDLGPPRGLVLLLSSQHQGHK